MKPCRLHPLQRPSSVRGPRQPSHSRATFEPPTPRLANHLQSPVPANPGRTLRDVEITSSSYTTQLNPKYPSFINCPLPCRACVPASLLPHPPPSKVYFFHNYTTVGTLPALSYHCTSTRRPANLEISVLPSSNKFFNHCVITTTTMSTKPIFVATHPRACSTAFERVRDHHTYFRLHRFSLDI